MYSNAQWIADLDMHATTAGTSTETCALVRKSVNKQNTAVITGSAELKESQHYPPGFGRAVCNVFLERREQLTAGAEAVMGTPVSWVRKVDGAPWAKAKLKEVVEFMGA